MGKRILFVGDSHGDLGYLSWVISRALEYEVDHIIQVGDFGYWEHTAPGRQFLDRLDELLSVSRVQLHWVDGNHENHTLLRSKYALREDGMVDIRPNIVYIPRGTRWKWGGTTFLGIGGAFSVDWSSRVLGESWWWEETITKDEVFRACEGGHADIVVSHDVPWLVNLSGHLWQRGVSPWHWDRESVENRQRLSEVFDVTTPKLWVHGHYHLSYTDYIGGCKFVGLDANINQYGDRNWSWKWSIKVMDTDNLR